MRASSFSHTLLIISIALAAGCGDGGSGGPVGEPDGGAVGEPDGGADSGTDAGEVEPPPPPGPEVYGAWKQSCDHLTEQDAIDACLDSPWELVLGRSELGDPATLLSWGGLCGETHTRGTFIFEEGSLELFNCGDGDPQSEPDAEGLLVEVRFADEGERMILTSDEAEHVLQRDPRAESTVFASRLMGISRMCESFYLSMRGHRLVYGESPVWVSTLVLQDGEILMDEFFNHTERPGMFGWNFYGSDHRGAQTRPFVLEPGVPTSAYRILRDENLTPIYATGFEMDDCDAANESAVRGFEHDFVRGVTFRRFWDETERDVDATAAVEVDLEGTVEEVLVTLRTNGLADASELTISLTSPRGTTVELLTAGTIASGAFEDFEYTSFADYAERSIADPALASLEDLVAPARPLAEFQGEPMAGTWTLTATRATGDPGGELRYFGLSLR